MSDEPYDVRVAATEADLRLWNDVCNAGAPLDAMTFDELVTWLDRPEPSRRVIAYSSSGEAVIAGFAFRAIRGSSVSLRLTRRGVDVPVDAMSPVIDVLLEWARTQDVERISSYCYDHDPREVAAWEALGWQRTTTKPVVGCDPATMPQVEVPTRDDLEFVTLDERPDLVRDVYDAYVASWSVTPWGKGADELQFARWWGNIERSAGAGADQFLLAIAGDRVVGYTEIVYAGLGHARLGDGPVSAWHAYTGVRPTHQGLGIATDLKRWSIAWARERGIEMLLGANDEDNTAMRGINERLGYVPQFAYVAFKLDD